MSTEEQRESAQHLSDLISKASQSDKWLSPGADEEVPPWQQDAISRILTLTFSQEIHYLSIATPESGDWDIVAFTDSTVVSLTVVRTPRGVSHIESIAVPRSSLESLELLSVAPITDSEDRWPDELSLVGHYRVATLRLPLDKFSSRDNKRDLVALLSSLVSDLGH